MAGHLFQRTPAGFHTASQNENYPLPKNGMGNYATIPFGETMTYGAIAVRIAKQKGLRQMSARAVGSAVGHNSISLIIPCHRVVGSEGKLTGYAGGLDKKVKLLELEKAQPISGKVTLSIGDKELSIVLNESCSQL